MRALFSQKKKKKKKKTRAQQHVPSSSSLRFFTRSLSSKTLKKARWWCQNVEMISVPLLHFFCFGDDGF